MRNNKFLLAAIVGTVTFFLLGFLIFGMALDSFMKSHSGLSAEVMAQVQKPMEQMNWGFMIVAHLFMGLLYATVLMWGGFNSTAAGARAGAILALLTSGFYDFLFLGLTNLYTLPGAAVDIIGSMIMGAIGGAVIGMVLAKGTSMATA